MTKLDKTLAPRKPGDLDLTFGQNGTVDVPVRAEIRALIEDDGGLVYVQWVSGECWLSRAFSDGTADPDFGDGSVAKWRIDSTQSSRPVQLIRQPDGKILLIGATQNTPERERTAITRFNPSGSPDLVFGTKILPFPLDPTEVPLFTRGHAGCLQNDGKVLLASGYQVGNGDSKIFEAGRLNRLNSDGSPDRGFGLLGHIEVRISGQNTVIRSIAVLSDNRIIVFGHISRGVYARLSLACYLPSGQLDQSFGKNGYWEGDEGSLLGDMTIHADKIVCTGLGEGPNLQTMVVYRLLANGEPDPIFNDGAPLWIDIPDLTDVPSGIEVQADQKILIGGAANRGPTPYMFWLRINDNGQLDPDFGNEGMVIYAEGLVRDLVVQCSRNRMIVAGDRVTPAGFKQLIGVHI